MQNSSRFNTETAQANKDSPFVLKSKYLKTDINENGVGSYQSASSALDYLEKSQNDWIRIEHYLKTSKNQ